MPIRLKDDGSSLVFEERGGTEISELFVRVKNDLGETEEVPVRLADVKSLYGKDALTQAGSDRAAKLTKRVSELQDKLAASADPEEMRRISSELDDAKKQLETAGAKARQDAAEAIKQANLDLAAAKKERDSILGRYRDSRLDATFREEAARLNLIDGTWLEAKALVAAHYGLDWEVPQEGGDAVPFTRIPVQQKNEAGETVTVTKKMGVKEAVETLANEKPHWRRAANGGTGGGGSYSPYQPPPGNIPPGAMNARQKLSLGLQNAKKG